MVSTSILAACQAENESIGDAIRNCNILDLSDDMGNGAPMCSGSASLYVEKMRQRFIIDSDHELFRHDDFAEYPDHEY